ncbi:transcription initiation factor TFIID subunit 7 [Mactra antiquata]
MSSGLKKKRDGGGEAVFDLEQQFILRLPPGPAEALHQELKNESVYLKDKFSIELQSDLRRGAVRFGNDYIPSKMVDLPCIIESHKTVDMKTFYKTADICQMLVPTTEEDIVQEEVDTSVNKKKGDKDKKFVWNHGITPPLKNVKKKRFRKTLKKKYMDQPDIEKEVKRLFRTDAEAISVSWELITDDDKGGTEKLEGTGGAGTSGSFKRTDTTASLDIDIFGELSTSDEEDEKDVNIVDSEDDRQQSNYMMKMEDSNDTANNKDNQLINLENLVLAGSQELQEQVPDMLALNQQLADSETLDATKDILNS